MKTKTHYRQNHRTAPLMNLRYFGTPVMLGLFLIQSAAAITWTGAGADDNWSTAGNWDSGSPGLADIAIFGEADAVANATTVNNIVAASSTIAALSYSHKTATNFQVTQIPSGTTLTVSGALTVGGSTAGTAVTKASITGDGVLVVNGTAMNVGNGDANTAQSGTILDLSGLANFTYNNSTGIFSMGFSNRSGASIKLATLANTITAATINLLTTSNSSSVNGALTLGPGTNVINANAINVGTQRGIATVNFANTNGEVKIRGTGGTDTDRTTIVAGWRNNSGGSGGTTGGTLSLNDHPVNMKLNVLTLGQSSNATATGVNTGNGVLSFNNGTIDVTTLRMAVCSAATGVATGTMTVGTGGTVTIGSGGISLANQTNGSSTGTLNISGGTVVCAGNVFKTTLVGTGNINLTSNGTVELQAGTTIGSTAIPVNNLNTTSSVLKMLATTGTTNITIDSLTTNGPGNTIQITAIPQNTLANDVFKLIQYTTLVGSAADFVLGPLPSGITAHLVDNNANKTIDLVIDTVTTSNLTWTGAVDGDWDTNKLNWKTGSPVAYIQNDLVTFNDTALGTTTINLTTALSPGSLTVDNSPSKNFTFTGTGSLTGLTGLTKSGSGTLTLANSGVNNFNGGVGILAGKLILGGSADRLPVNANVTLADTAGAGLDLNNLNQTIAGLTGGGATGGNVSLGSGILTLTGTGSHGGVISGSGSLTKSGPGTQVLAGANLYSGGTLISDGRITVANTTGSGLGSGPVQTTATGVLAIGNADATGSIAAATIINDGRLVLDRSDDFTFGKLIEGIGTVAKESVNNTVTLETANTYTGPTTINGGALLVTHASALGTAAGNTFISNAVSARLVLSGAITLPEPLTISTKASTTNAPAIQNISGDNTLSGPISLTTGGSYWTLMSDSDKLTITGTMTNTATTNTRTIRLRGEASGEIQSNLGNSTGNLSLTAVLKEDAGTWTLSGTNTNTGGTTISAGTLLINGTHTTSAITVAFGGTLGGTGTVGAVTSGGTLSPGTSIGTLNAGATTLTGILAIEVNGAASDLLNVTGALDLTSSTVVITGTPVAASYTLATATSITGTPVLETAIPGYELVVVGTSLKLNSTSGVTPYDSWATLKNLVGNDALPTADPENDGLNNAMEFVLGGDPKANDNPPVRPQITTGASSITLTFKRSDASELQPVTVKVQVSTDLATWNPADAITIGATNGSGPNGATYTVDETGTEDSIAVTIPMNSATRKFVRVEAVMP